jgi:hypothetical protein
MIIDILKVTGSQKVEDSNPSSSTKETETIGCYFRLVVTKSQLTKFQNPSIYLALAFL